MNLSLVIPVYNEAESLAQLHQEIHAAFPAKEDYEILFIDDGSSDGSGALLKELADRDVRVKVVTLYRNYGKAAALSAGFRSCIGDLVVTMDSDLQDDPKEIQPMLDVLQDGWDLVSGWKKARHDPLSKRLSSKLFNFVVRLMTRVRIHDFNCGLKAYRAEVVKNLDLYGGLHRYIPALAKYRGFRVTEKVVRHRSRQYGRTKYGTARYLHGLLDLLTVLFLGKYFQRPLHFFGLIGLLAAVAGVVISLYLTIGWFLGEWIGNRPLFFLGILLIIVGLQFFSLGLLAEMVTQRRYKDQNLVKEVYQGKP